MEGEKRLVLEDNNGGGLPLLPLMLCIRHRGEIEVNEGVSDTVTVMY